MPACVGSSGEASLRRQCFSCNPSDQKEPAMTKSGGRATEKVGTAGATGSEAGKSVVYPGI